MFKNKKEGFTLAEVLIALVIIGVVAAITVPTIVANSNEKALKAALKKNHSILEQALRKYYIDNGINLGADGETSNILYIQNNFFYKYFNVACSGTDCDLKNVAKEYRTYDGKYKADVRIIDSSFKLILNDGTLLEYSTGNSRYKTMYLFIDVNGPYKNPNQIGKDTFLYQIFYENGKVVPGGASESNFPESTLCTKKSYSTQNGYGCTAKMLKD